MLQCELTEYGNKTHTVIWIFSFCNVLWNCRMRWSIVNEKIPRNSFKQVFKNLNILIAPTKHVYTLLQQVCNNKEEYFAQHYDQI